MKFARLMLGASLVALCSTTPAFAQSAAPSVSEAAIFEFDIPEQSLAAALSSFAQTADVQFAYSADLVSGRSGRTLKGRYTVQEALARLLAGTGLTWRAGAGKAIVLEAVAQPDDGERVLGAVRVQGAQGGSSLAGSTPVNGVNGSRDVTATEGTGSYTSNALTVGSKTAQSIKDTPMAVSVITNQRIQDQNIVSLADAMRNAPGVSMVQDANAPTGTMAFFSRGYQITQIQVDGGAAQIAGGSGRTYRPVIDMSLYDHIELVRGATGTFNAYGDPSGVINLVRKKPLDHSQMLLEMQLGSWEWHRVSADITGPLGLDGALRGRLIATHQDNKFFYDISKANRNIVSAIVEYDASPSTLISVGADIQSDHNVPWRYGLSRYITGKLVDLPRSTCLCFTWAKDDRDSVELFGQLEQKIGSDWNFKLKLSRDKQKNTQLSPLLYPGPVDPNDPAHAVKAQFDGAYVLNGGYSIYRLKQTQIELTIDGSFRLFGQTQKVILGANYSMLDPKGSTSYNTPYFTNGTYNYYVPVDIFHFNPNDWPDPGVGDPGSRTRFGDLRILNSYASFDLTPLARLHVISALRYSAYRDRRLTDTICTSQNIADNYPPACTSVGQVVTTGAGQLFKNSSFSWPPSVQVRYDISRNLTGYVIYTDIYRPNLATVDANLKPIAPTTGSNVEGGLKWLSPNQKINVSLSGYYIRKHGFADYAGCTRANPSECRPDTSGASPGTLVNINYCCYVFNANARERSFGVDFEVGGEIRRGWQVSASYSFNKNFPRTQSVYAGQAVPLNSFMPRHLFKLWSTYDFGDDSALRGVVIGFGFNGQSKTFVNDSYCPQVQPIKPYGCAVDTIPVAFSDPGHVVFNASLGYKVNDSLRFDAEVENLLDKTYLETVGSLGSYNWYGSPRSFKLTLRGKF